MWFDKEDSVPLIDGVEMAERLDGGAVALLGSPVRRRLVDAVAAEAGVDISTTGAVAARDVLLARLLVAGAGAEADDVRMRRVEEESQDVQPLICGH